MYFFFFTLAIGRFKSYFIYHTGVTNIVVKKGKKGKMLEKELNLKSTRVDVKMGKQYMSQGNHPVDESPCLFNVCGDLGIPLPLIPILLCPLIYHKPEKDVRDYIIQTSPYMEEIEVYTKLK